MESWEKGHEPRAIDFIAACIVLSVVQVLVVAAHFYTRHKKRARYGLDDYMILFALIASISKAILYIVMVKHGIDDTTEDKMDKISVRKSIIALEILDVPLTITPAKLSILLFYTRVFPIRKFQILAYVIGSVVLAKGIAAFFETIFQCHPVLYGVHMGTSGGYCIDQTLVYRYFGCCNVITGTFILIMPLPLVWRLHMPRAQKIALTAIFLLGSFGLGASILRLVGYFSIGPSRFNNVSGFPVRLVILTVIEGTVLIIAFCMITIWPLFVLFSPRRLFCTIFRRQAKNSHTSQHRAWYSMTLTHISTKSNHRGSVREDSSPSIIDLEDQRTWVALDEPEFYDESLLFAK